MISANKDGTFIVEDLATRATVVLPPKSGELLTAVKAIFGILVAHPELFAQQFAAQLADWPSLVIAIQVAAIVIELIHIGTQNASRN